MTINNTIFERKHHYMYILKESEVLRRQMNEDLFDGLVDPGRLDETNQLYSLAFAGLLQEGLAYQYAADTDPAKDNVVITIDHADYTCRASVLRGILKDRYAAVVSKDGGMAREMPEPVSAPAPMPVPVPETTKAPEPPEAPVPTSRTEPEGGAVSETTNEASDIFDQMFSELRSLAQQDSGEDEDDIFGEEEKEESKPVSDTVNAAETAENPEPETPAPLPGMGHAGNDVVEDAAVPEDTGSTADSAPGISSMPARDIFLSETMKKKDTFLYQIHRITALHEGSRHGEDITFFIAPLEVRKDIPNAPIAVLAYYNGEYYFDSSYKHADKNRVIINNFEIGSYAFLVRGSVTDYKFEAQIYTTGQSTDQGDRINTLSVQSCEPENTAAIKSGHIKFTYETKNGTDGVVEVFPVDGEDNNFLTVWRHDGWLDYNVSGRDGDPFLETSDGLQTVVSYWEGDTLKSELVPASH